MTLENPHGGRQPPLVPVIGGGQADAHWRESRHLSLCAEAMDGQSAPRGLAKA
jgi:hypothetical protein